jgi:putative salt-induced outer membrane protein YdiY
MLPIKPLSSVFCLSLALVAASLAVGPLAAQAPEKPTPDVLVLTDGERLVGKFLNAAGGQVTFKSNMAGVLTVNLADVEELKSEGKFVVFAKGAAVHTAADATKLPTGTVSVAAKKLEVKPASGPAQSMPVADVGKVLNATAVDAAQKPASLLQNWHGLANLGLTLQAATTDSRTATLFASFTRDSPGEGWLKARNRTHLDYFGLAFYSYKRFDPTTTHVALFQANFVQEHYWNSKWFVFGGASFEHASTQGLDLLQAYGGGVGYKLLEGKHGELDVRGGLGFMRQEFVDPSINRSMLGSRFGMSYSKTFHNGIVFSLNGGARPAWTYPKAFFAGGNMSLTIPISKHFGFNITENETFLNLPSPYRRKNTSQSAAGFNVHF